MAEQTVELYTGSATGTQIDAAVAKVAAMEETLSGTAATIPSSAAVKNYVDSKSVDTASILLGNAVYDISEANNGTTYANLAAALNNGNNIPASIRKGGISIKFIQSSDNKYVQYRLTANAFSTDVTQWQGIDDTITKGSHNFVESGTIYEELNEDIDIDVSMDVSSSGGWSASFFDEKLPSGTIIKSISGLESFYFCNQDGSFHLPLITTRTEFPYTLEEDAYGITTNAAQSGTIIYKKNNRSVQI